MNSQSYSNASTRKRQLYAELHSGEQPYPAARRWFMQQAVQSLIKGEIGHDDYSELIAYVCSTRPRTQAAVHRKVKPVGFWATVQRALQRFRQIPP